MNKIINNKKYNTETAKEVCEDRRYSCGSWHSSHYLYKKKTGEFFIFHLYDSYDPFTPASYIEPISEQKALHFAQEVMDGDDYESFFGEVDE